MKALFFGLIGILISSIAPAQYWQQHVNYDMQIDMNTNNHRFTGVQTLTYTNNSPDTLKKVYYHLYFNAFQPGSMMDERSRAIQDPDRRVGDRIAQLKKDEIGYHKIDVLTQNGTALKYEMEGTILSVTLAEAIAPGASSTFYMEFNSQVPVQIRRSGRNNKEGIAYTMTQWYPKMAEYDKDGWHPNPYVGREFYGVWGNFSVSITLNSNYIVGGTGIGVDKMGAAPFPVEGEEMLVSDTKTWHFEANNVHDFAWAADPDYQHDMLQVPNGPELHFYYQTDTLAQQWKEVQPMVVRLFEIMSAKFGEYPYPQFSVIQGGDGGMEYPMCTMIKGHGNLKGKVGLIAHEAFHNWYYGILGNNEFRYPWLDEGFTSYAEEIVLDSLYGAQALNPLQRSYASYAKYAVQPYAEPMSTPADFFNYNYSYGVNSYSKGAIFLHQLGYVIGKEALEDVMLTYFDEWKFKHPSPYDFIRLAERETDLELSWYLEHWMLTLKTIDYGIESVEKKGSKTLVNLVNEGTMPMPVDVYVTYKDGSSEVFYIPLVMMRGEKAGENNTPRKVMADWPWTNPSYTLEIDRKLKDIVSIEIDPSQRMADFNAENNSWKK